MLFGELVTVAEYPVGVLPPGRNFGIADPFASLDPDDSDLTYLLEASPFDPEGEGSWIGPPAPVGVLPVGVFGYSYLGAAKPVYLGDHHNYLSLAGDDPANTPFDGRLTPAYSLSARLGSSSDPLGGAAVDIGNIGISNGDGAYDDLLRRSFGGRRITIRVGKADWSYNSFARALVGTALNPRAGSETEISIPVTTILSRLDRPVARRYYAGTGGREGGPELAGQPVPKVFGWRPQVAAKLLDAAKQIWQFAEALHSIADLRDRGVGGFTGGDDHADYEALAAAVLAPGDFATCLAEGLVRFGSNVTLPTAEVEGPEAVGNLAGGIALHIAQACLGSGRNLGGDQVDAGAFAALDAARPWETGIYLDGEATARQVIDALMRDVLAALVGTRDGLMSCSLYALPADAPSSIEAADIDTAGVALEERVPAAKRVTVSYAPRDRVLGPSEMTEAVPAAERLQLGSAAMYVVETRSPADADAIDVAIATGLRHKADAEAMADMAANILSALTHRYRVPIVGRPFRHWLGDLRRLVYDRFDSEGGLNCIVAGIDESNEGGNSLLLWGPRGSQL